MFSDSQISAARDGQEFERCLSNAARPASGPGSTRAGLTTPLTRAGGISVASTKAAAARELALGSGQRPSTVRCLGRIRLIRAPLDSRLIARHERCLWNRTRATARLNHVMTP